MSYERTISAAIPATGRTILATALLEAPERDGPWTAIEATEGAAGEMATRHARFEHGWYRLQWHDDGNVSQYSDAYQPVPSPVTSTPIPEPGYVTPTTPLRKFTCGERDWLEEHGVDVKAAQRFPRGMTLAEIVQQLDGD